MTRGWALPACTSALAFALAAAATRVLLALRAPASIAPDLSQPLAVVTAWHGFGAALAAALLAALAAAFAFYLLALRRLERDGGAPPSALAVAGVAALGIAAAWTLPVLFSSDVYAYAAYGELARLGSDPYAHAPLPAADPLFAAAIFQWGNPPPQCVYGPVFVALAAASATALHALGPRAVLDALRALACAALLLCVPLARRAFPGDDRARALAAATISLNPVALWCAAEGHNDAIAVALALAAFALLRARGAAWTSSIAAVLAAAVKLPAIVVPVVLAVRVPRVRAGAIAAVAAALLVSAPLALEAGRHLAPHARYAPQASVQAAFAVAADALLPESAAPIAAWLAAAALAIACGARAIALLRAGEVQGWAVLAAAGWMLVPNPYPWYGLWLLPIAALAPRTPAAQVLLGLSLFSALRYVPDAVGMPPPASTVLLALAASLPLFALRRPVRRLL